MNTLGAFRAGDLADRIEFEAALARIAAHCGPENRNHVDALRDRALALADEGKLPRSEAMRLVESEFYEGQVATRL